MPNLIDNLLFEHFDKFQAYSPSVCENVESKFFLENEFCRSLSFYNLSLFLMTNLISPLLALMSNFINSSLTFLVQETAWKKKTGRINLINT